MTWLWRSSGCQRDALTRSRQYLCYRKHCDHCLLAMPHSSRPSTPPTTNKVSLATAKCIPVFIAAVVLYVSFTITGPLGISYLIIQKHELATGIAVVVVWFVLLVPVAVTWARLLGVVFGDAGFVPRGEEAEQQEKGKREGSLGLEEWWGRDVFVCTSIILMSGLLSGMG